jgi:hypothetical protein
MQQYQDLLIDALLDQGFTLFEAERLITLQERFEHAHRQTQQEQECRHWLMANRKGATAKNHIR